MRLVVVMEKNRALSVDQCWLQALQFLVYLFNLLSILLRCNGFARIQKAVVDQRGSRAPSSDHDCFWCTFGFGKCFGASQSNHWAGCHWQWCKITIMACHNPIKRWFAIVHRMREDDTTNQWFFNFQLSHEAPTFEGLPPFQFASNAEELWNGRWCVLWQLPV